MAFVGDVTQHQLNSIFRAADAAHEVTSEHHLKTTRNVCQDDHRGTAKARKSILGFALITSETGLLILMLEKEDKNQTEYSYFHLLIQ